VQRAMFSSTTFWLTLALMLVCTRVFGQAPAKNLFSAKTVYLKVENYRNSNVSAKDLEVVRRRAASALAGFKRYALVPEPEDADVVFNVAFANDYVYGKYRSQSAPTVFLRIEDSATNTLLYCGSGHSGFLTSATKTTFGDLRRKIEVHDPSLDQPSSLCDFESPK
jgi:hypothetical protein